MPYPGLLDARDCSHHIQGLSGLDASNVTNGAELHSEGGET